MHYMWNSRRDSLILTKSMFLFTLVRLIIDPDIRCIGLSQSLIFPIPFTYVSEICADGVSIEHMGHRVILTALATAQNLRPVQIPVD